MSGSNGASSSMMKKTKGKQKIDIKLIERDEERMVTFSKRKSGIIKKCSELVTLCGANVCFVVFSPAGKAFSYGHPSVDSLLSKFMNENPPLNDDTNPFAEAKRNARIDELIKQINETTEMIETELEKAKTLEQLIPPKAKGTGWWEVSTENLCREQCLKLEDAIDETIAMAKCKILEKMDASRASRAISPPLPPSTLMDASRASRAISPPLPPSTTMGGSRASRAISPPLPPSTTMGASRASRAISPPLPPSTLMDRSRILSLHPLHPMVMMDLNTPYPDQMVNYSYKNEEMNDDGAGPSNYYDHQPCDDARFPPRRDY